MMIYVKTDIVPNEKKRVFIVHGICEHSGDMIILLKD